MSITLFTSLFAGQAALIAMSPVLTEAASDLDVSTAAAGQLRTLAGLTAGITALLMGRLSGRFGLGRQLVGAALLLALGSLGERAAPSFALLALAQLPVGVAVADPDHGRDAGGSGMGRRPSCARRRSRGRSSGSPRRDRGDAVDRPRRRAQLALQLARPALRRSGRRRSPVGATRRGGAPAAALPPARARVALADPVLARWLLSELLVNSAWAGMLVYAGALYAESYGSSSGQTGFLLALAAGAYVAGNLSCRRLTRYEASNVLIVLAFVLAVAGVLFGVVRPDPLVSTAFLSVAAFASGARTLVSSTFALATAPALRPAVMRLRASTMQFG